MPDLQVTKNPMDAFQEQVVERLRNDIRDLLPEEALTVLVQRAVDETFFQQREVKSQYRGSEFHPSWFVEEVTKAAKPMLNAAVERFVVEQQAVIDKALAEFLTTERLQILLADRLAYYMTSALSTHLEQVRQLR